ncbi:MAG: hypothetical protein K0R24_575 [Gammaproteobacteria bacterium]|jgi:amino acid adenylation domain-containing protein/non-ribosomal peptide synthase protein (TIGR01720 family)|nr:hypothetical protein [Gammaproteobacteria bacterium]
MDDDRSSQFTCCLIGGTNLLIQSAEILLSQHHSILLIVSSDPEVQAWADENNISHTKLLSALAALKFDYLFSIVNETILSKEIINLSTQFAINYHDSLLPKYAGVYATSWALLNGETQHGVTWHVINSDVDAGDVLKQSSVTIDENDTAVSLNVKCYQAALTSFSELINELQNGTYKKTEQDLSQRSYYGLYKKPSNTWISWQSSAEEIMGLCRALDFGHYINKLASPKFILGKELFSIQQMTLLKTPSTTQPGTIVSIHSNGIEVSTKTYHLLISKACSTRRDVSLQQYCQDKKIRVGECLLSPSLTQSQQFDEFYRKIAKYESFWVTELQKIMYANFPFFIEKNNFIKSKKFTLINTFYFSPSLFWDKNNISHILLTAWFIYLARINQQNSIGISLSHTTLFRNTDSYYPVASNTIPFSVVFNENLNFFEMLRCIEKKMALLNRNMTYINDLNSRLPEFRKMPSSPIIALLSDENKNFDFSKISEPIIFLINEKKHSAQILLREDQQNLYLQYALDRVPDHLKTLLNAVEENAEQSISTLPILPPSEMKKMTVEWNNTITNYPRDKTVYQLFEEQVEKTPDQIAVIFGKKQVTYNELNQRANQLAHHLKKQKITIEMPVGIFLERSIDFIVSALAIIKAGGAYVPFDPAYPDDRICYMLRDCNIKMLLSCKKYQTRIKKILPSLQALINLDEDQSLFEKEPTHNLEQLTYANHLIYIMYTSGSTGQPKGIEIVHRGVVRLVKSTNYINIKPSDCVAHISNLAFDASTFEIWGALLNGARLIIIKNEILFSPNLFKKKLSSYQVNTLCITPALFNQLIEIAPSFTDGLNTLFFGGDQLSLFNIKKILDRKDCPIRIINGYGSAENTTCTTYYEIPRDSQLTSSIPIGTPIANTLTYVCDGRGQLLPIGAVGELYVGGDGLARGYFNKSKLTAQKFISNPFDNKISPMLYKTGDRVRWLPDGNLEYIGRIDNQIKIRGFRVELEEVEKAINTHPTVSKAVVSFEKIEDARKTLIAFVINHKHAVLNKKPIDSSQLRDFLKKKLPNYMIPSTVYSVDHFPLTENGKIDRKKLLEQIRDKEVLPLADNFIFSVPTNTIQSQLLAIWHKLFKLEKISIHDNFFDLGGDSILAIQACAKAQSLDIPLTPKHIFQDQTIAKIASNIEFVKKKSQKKPILSNNVPLIPIQAWFFNLRLEKKEQFSQACLVKMEGEINSLHLENCLNALLRKYDAFRLYYKKTDGRWTQFYSIEATPLILENRDLSSCAESRIQFAIKEMAYQSQENFDLEKGALFHATLIKTSHKNSTYLLLVAHHLIIDGVSWRLLLNNLEKLYQGDISLMNNAHLLEASTFHRWAKKINQYAKTSLPMTSEKYWDHICKKTFHLACDYEKGNNSEASSATEEFSLSIEETNAFIQIVTKKTHFKTDELLLGTLVNVLATWCQSKGVLIDLERHGRESTISNRMDLSNTIGWFTSLFPMYFTHNKKYSLIAIIESVHKQLKKIERNGIDYGVLRYLRSHGERLHCTPPVSFNYWGQFDSIFEKNKLFQFEYLRLISHPNNLRTHLMNVDIGISHGKLLIHWSYSKNFHKKLTIQKLMKYYVGLLQALIKECSLKQKIAPPKNKTFIPDLPQRTPNTLTSLTAIQKGLLFHTINKAGCEAYTVQVVCELKKTIHTDLLRKSLDLLIERHSMLRSYFKWKGIEPQRHIQEVVKLPWREYDWQEVSKENQLSSRLDHFLKIDRQANFCLKTPPLIRATLIKLADKKYTFILSLHHILLDGWSMAVLMTELGQIYQALQASQSLNLPKPVSFKCYMDWLNQQDSSKAKYIWKKYLSGFNTATDSIIVNRNNASQLIDYSTKTLAFPKNINEKIKQFCNAYKFTLSTFMQGIWALLLSRYSQSDDIVFGMTVSIRPPEVAQSDKIIGSLINTIPLRVKIENSFSVIEYLKAIQSNFWELIDYAYTPLSDIKSLSEIEAGSDLFETLLVVENYPTHVIPGLNIKFENIKIFDPTHYPLSLAVTSNTQLKIKFSYDKNRVLENKIKSLVEHFRILVLEAIEKPYSLVSELELISKKERKLFIHQWNNTCSHYNKNKTVHQLFEEQVNKTPDNIAISFENESLSYQKLNEKANQVAHYLRKNGVKPETIVALGVQRGLEMVIGMLGILKAGAAYLPIDPSYPKARIQYMLEDSQVKFILTQLKIMTELQSVIPSSIKLIPLDNQQILFKTENKYNPSCVSRAHHLVHVIYTSGSTGKPKGVLIEHHAVINTLESVNKKIRLKPKNKWLAITSISFDTSGLEIYLPLLAGAQCVVASSDVTTDGKKLKKILDDEKISFLQATPMTFKMLLEAEWHNKNNTKILCAGEPLTKNLSEKLLARTKSFWNGYGPTETTILSTMQLVSYKNKLSSILPIGRPIANTQVYVLNKYLKMSPVGVIGELFIGGVGLSRGYLNQPMLTNEKFIPNPFDPKKKSRLYKTGDLVRWLPDGRLEYIGRNDEQIKIRGFRVELGEIQTHIEKYSFVKQAIVVGYYPIPNKTSLAAFIITNDKNNFDTEQLRLYLKKFLPHYMIPSTLVVVDEFPLSPNKKIDKNALVQLAKVHSTVRMDKTKINPPITAEERAIAKIWSEVLSISYNSINRNDNFFDLGGDSLTALQVFCQICSKFYLELELQLLIENPTVMALAEKIKFFSMENASLVAATRKETDNLLKSCLIPLKPSGHKPPLFLIHPVGGTVFWYVSLTKYFDPDRPLYGIQDPGIVLDHAPFTDIEEMAKNYIKVMRSVQPKGPYFIGGASAGSNISVEITHQLMLMGEEVAFIALLDGWAYYPTTLENRELFEGIMLRQYNMMHEKFVDKGIARADKLLKLQWQRSQMNHRYRPPYLPKKLTLFKAENTLPLFQPIDDSLNHWGAYSSQPIELCMIPGDHETMFNEPNVQMLAELLNAKIDQVEVAR